METPSPLIVQKNLPQFYKTLKPESTSISSKFEPIDLEKPQFHPSSSSLGNKTADNHQKFVSDVLIFQVNDRHYGKFKNKASSSTARNVVIDLNDDNYGGKGGGAVLVVDDDDDCIFVKREKSSTPKGNNKKDPLCIEEFKELKPKLGKNFSIGIHDFNSVQCVDDYDDDNDEIRIINVKPSSSTFSLSTRKRRKPFSGPSVSEIGESSGSKFEGNDEMVSEIDDPIEMTFLCEICADSKPQKEAFSIKGCSHSYCSDCMKTYVASKLQDGVSLINCPAPSCSGVLEPEYCREILPFEVFVRWGNLLCESVILASQKFYCPFKDCSALLVDDGSEKVTMSECPSCFRMFCAQCRVGWHAGIECAEYQSLSKDERDKDDIMLRKLAKSKNWQRCPKCKYYVEKSEGCLYMKCR